MQLTNLDVAVTGGSPLLRSAVVAAFRGTGNDAAAVGAQDDLGGRSTLVHLGVDTEDELHAVRDVRLALAAAVRAGVRHVVVATSVIAYAGATSRTQRADERWPVTGVPGSRRSRAQACVEQLLDTAERQLDATVTRLRPGLVVPAPQRPGAVRDLPARPWLEAAQTSFEGGVIRMSVQALPIPDLARACVLAAAAGVPGAFNLAERRPRGLVVQGRTLQPGWIDAALQAPLMQVDRAARELGWVAAADAALRVAARPAARPVDGTRQPQPAGRSGR